MKIAALGVSCMLSAAACAGGPKYVFMIIGDGFSVPQRMVAEEFSREIGRGELTCNHLPYHATTRTSSATSLVTDSAAAGTAGVSHTVKFEPNGGTGGTMEPQTYRLDFGGGRTVSGTLAAREWRLEGVVPFRAP